MQVFGGEILETFRDAPNGVLEVGVTRRTMIESAYRITSRARLLYRPEDQFRA
jgi:hypothetical protein